MFSDRIAVAGLPSQWQQWQELLRHESLCRISIHCFRISCRRMFFLAYEASNIPRVLLQRLSPWHCDIGTRGAGAGAGPGMIGRPSRRRARWIFAMHLIELHGPATDDEESRTDSSSSD